ncbi:MAG: zinc-ribbon domain-containing protein [Syntrophothermus sp.]
MTNCPNCGYKLDAEHNFCPSCGYDIRENEQPAEGTAAETAAEQAEDRVVCDVCGEETPAASGYCESCGVKLTGKEKGAEKKAEEPAEKRPAEPQKEVKKDTQVNIKPKQAAQKPAGQKKAVKPAAVRQSQLSQSGKSLNTKMLGIILGGLFVLGALILYLAGVFDSPVHEHVQSDMQEGQQGQMNLGAVQELDALEADLRKDTSNYPLILELAHKLNDNGFKEKAIDYYNRYLRKYPVSTDVLVDRGVCYFELRKFDQAKQSMIKAWKINPKHQIANFNLGIVHSQSGSPDSAKIWWARAAEIDPNSEIGRKSKELLVSQ